jgi:hypothetical protein
MEKVNPNTDTRVSTVGVTLLIVLLLMMDYSTKLELNTTIRGSETFYQAQ